jgi:hypothetical protein
MQENQVQKKVIAATTICALIATPALAFTEPFPGSYRESRDITCPAQYPIKTGEGVMGGGYITTCWTQQAWNLQMAGGDDWTAWLNGTYTPAPTPTPTITITATPAPQIVERTITVAGATTEIIKEIPAPLPDTSTAKKIKKEIARMKKEIKKLEQKLRAKKEQKTK